VFRVLGSFVSWGSGLHAEEATALPLGLLLGSEDGLEVVVLHLPALTDLGATVQRGHGLAGQLTLHHLHDDLGAHLQEVGGADLRLLGARVLEERRSHHDGGVNDHGGAVHRAHGDVELAVLGKTIHALDERDGDALRRTRLGETLLVGADDLSALLVGRPGGARDVSGLRHLLLWGRETRKTGGLLRGLVWGCILSCWLWEGDLLRGAATPSSLFILD
jgi:hypothetical protein